MESSVRFVWPFQGSCAPSSYLKVQTSYSANGLRYFSRGIVFYSPGETFDWSRTHAVTSLVREGIKCCRAILWPPQLRTLALRLGYDVTDLHMASHDYQEVIQHTHTLIHTLPHSQNRSIFFSLKSHLSFSANSSGLNESSKYYWIKTWVTSMS